MYIERKEKFSFKSFFLIILIVLLFIFLIIWLVPKKSNNKKLQSEIDLNEIKDIYGDVFSNNMKKMKNSAINYFVPKRLPKSVDDSMSLTLSQMYNLGIISNLKDKNKKSCDKDESYVEITKNFSNYKMIVSLKCEEDEDYIIVYLNNYSYCKNKSVCEKRALSNNPTSKEIKVKEEERKTVTSDEEKENKETKEEKEEETINKINKVTLYEYSKVTETNISCSEWSEWQKDKVESSSTRKVETKEVNEVVDYKYETLTKQVKERQVVGYSTRLVENGTEQIEVGKKYIKSTNSYVPVYKTIKVYKEEKVPIYDYKLVDKTDNVKKEVYGLVTYYRYQDCKDSIDIKYSYVDNDNDLLSKGYKLTGNTKEG